MNISGEIKFLRYISIAHFLVIIASIYLSFLGKSEYYYHSELYYGIAKYSLIFIIIFLLIPLLLILPQIYRNNIKIMKIFKIICFSFIFISFIIGLLINISIWKTSTEAKSFISYCPYHFTPSLLSSIIQKKSNKKKFCNVRACFLYSENEDNSLGYIYICNYDSYNDFKSKNNGKIYKRINSKGEEITSNYFIKCYKIKNLSVSKEYNLQYFDICNQSNYYECMLFEKPKEKDYTSVNNKDSCPGKSYANNVYLLGVSFLLVDIVCFTFLFFIEYLIMKQIVLIIQSPETNQNPENQATINSTVNKNNQQDENKDNQEFKKEPTETIIVAPENKEDKYCETPERKKDEIYDDEIINTYLTNKNPIRIKNLKSTSSNIKLLNLNCLESDRKDRDKDIDNNNENYLEIKINHKNKNRKISNQETIVRSAEVDKSYNYVKSSRDENTKKKKLYLNEENNNEDPKNKRIQKEEVNDNINGQQTERIYVNKK